MKILALLVVLCMVGATSASLFGFSDAMTASDVASTRQAESMVNTSAGRKLKGSGHSLNSELKLSEEESVSLEDYRPVDPAPSSKTSIKPAPIVHGTPLMPYIPQPSPPGPPKHSD